MVPKKLYQLGSFFVQFGFLFAAICGSPDKILQDSSRLASNRSAPCFKLSVSGQSTDHQAESPVHFTPPEASPYWLAPAPPQPAQSFVTSKDNPIHLVPSGPGFFGWLKSPMAITNGQSSFHRVLRWLQSPASN